MHAGARRHVSHSLRRGAPRRQGVSHGSGTHAGAPRTAALLAAVSRRARQTRRVRAARGPWATAGSRRRGGVRAGGAAFAAALRAPVAVVVLLLGHVGLQHRRAGRHLAGGQERARQPRPVGATAGAKRRQVPELTQNSWPAPAGGTRLAPHHAAAARAATPAAPAVGIKGGGAGRCQERGGSGKRFPATSAAARRAGSGPGSARGGARVLARRLRRRGRRQARVRAATGGEGGAAETALYCWQALRESATQRAARTRRLRVHGATHRRRRARRTAARRAWGEGCVRAAAPRRSICDVTAGGAGGAPARAGARRPRVVVADGVARGRALAASATRQRRTATPNPNENQASRRAAATTPQSRVMPRARMRWGFLSRAACAAYAPALHRALERQSPNRARTEGTTAPPPAPLRPCLLRSCNGRTLLERRDVWRSYRTRALSLAERSRESQILFATRSASVAACIHAPWRPLYRWRHLARRTRLYRTRGVLYVTCVLLSTPSAGCQAPAEACRCARRAAASSWRPRCAPRLLRLRHRSAAHAFVNPDKPRCALRSRRSRYAALRLRRACRRSVCARRRCSSSTTPVLSWKHPRRLLQPPEPTRRRRSSSPSAPRSSWRYDPHASYTPDMPRLIPPS
jgi:hypothetical protein